MPKGRLVFLLRVQVLEKDAQATAGMLGNLLSQDDRGHIHTAGTAQADSNRHSHESAGKHHRKVVGHACLDKNIRVASHAVLASTRADGAHIGSCMYHC